MVQHPVTLCIIATWKKSCTYSQERHVTRVWETAVHDDSVLLTRSLHTQSTSHVNLLLKVKQQRWNRQDRRRIPWKKWPKKVHKGIKSLSSIPIPPISEFFAFSGDSEWAFLQERVSVSYVGGRQWAEEEPQIQQNCEKPWDLHMLFLKTFDISLPMVTSKRKNKRSALNSIHQFDEIYRWRWSLPFLRHWLHQTNSNKLNVRGVFPCKTDKQRFQCVVCGCTAKSWSSLQTWLQYNASLRQLQCLHSKQ